jgi:homoserine kinase type II
MHLAGQDYPNQQKNLRSLSWWQETIPLVLPYLAPVQHDLLTQELGFQEQFFASDTYADLPMGPGHCDLFRDNILFDTIDGQDHLCGVFDFYFAGYDTWLFDLAVTVNDWCVDLQSGLLDSARAYALLHAYHAIRPFQASEKYCWPAMLRAAALRFWVSRLWDFYLPRSAKIVQLHDPTHFERILHHHTQTLHSPWIT